jgi:eukaryotic-like serine/threonine-protein kinase
MGRPVVAGDKIFVATESGVEARTTNDGRSLWRQRFDRYLPSSLLVCQNKLLVAEQTVYADDMNTGKRLWTFTPSADTSLGDPACDEKSFFVGTSDHRVYALDLSSGALRWKIDLGPTWEHKAVIRGITLDRDSLFVSVERLLTGNANSIDGWLFRLDAGSGKTVWSYGTSSEPDRTLRSGFSSAPVISHRMVLTSDFLGSAVRALDEESGKLLWKSSDFGGFVGLSASPLVQGEHVYFAAGGRLLRSADLRTGKVEWESRLYSTPTAYTLCGSQILVNLGSIEKFALADGKKPMASVLPSTQPITSDFAQGPESGALFAFGPNAMYKFDCQAATAQ